MGFRRNPKVRKSVPEAEVQQDNFLRDWLAQSIAQGADAKRFEESTGFDEQEAMAVSRGFRTWRQHRSCMLHCHALVELFVDSDAFVRLWKRLGEIDALDGFGPQLYGPHNRGVAAGLLRSLECWYQQPKLTKSSRAKHNSRIVALCGELLDLLGQVTPSGALDQLAELRVTPPQSEALFDRFSVPEERRNALGKHPGSRARFVSGTLAGVGMTPTWAIRSLAASARLAPFNVLPPKVNTLTAFRTHLIRDLNDALFHLGSSAEDGRPISDDLFAEVVSLVANVDCSIDDVRKAIKQQALEKKRRHDDLMVHREVSP